MYTPFLYSGAALWFPASPDLCVIYYPFAQGLVALSHKFSRTCQWFITQGMSDKPWIRLVQRCVRGCMHEEWEAGLRSRGMCSQGCHWGAGSPEHMGLPSCSLLSVPWWGWCHWLGQGWAGALGSGAAACCSHCILRAPGMPSWSCIQSVPCWACVVSLWLPTERAHKKIAECGSFLFSFFIFWKGRDGTREWRLGSELKSLFPVWPWICFWPFVYSFSSLLDSFQTAKVRKIAVFPAFIKVLWIQDRINKI